MDVANIRRAIREAVAAGQTPVLLRGAHIVLPPQVCTFLDIQQLFDRFKKGNEYWIVTDCHFESRPGTTLEQSFLPALERARAGELFPPLPPELRAKLPKPDDTNDTGSGGN